MKLIKILIAIVSVVVVGCSSNGVNPTVPVETQSDYPYSIPVFNNDQVSENHALLGSWKVEFDINNKTAYVDENRSSSSHYNVTDFIPQPQITINSYNPTTHVIDVDVTLENPYPIEIYDVRLIIFTDDFGHMLRNDDGWTPLYDIPDGMPVNPFRTYCKDDPNRTFYGLSQETENLQIYLPGGNPFVSFAVDASFPGNCEEPHKIGDLEQGIIYSNVGSSTLLQVGVYDHQNDVNSVNLHCPAITGTDMVPFEYIGYNGWEMLLANNTRASPGDYYGFLVATSSNSGTLPLYKLVTITVTAGNSGWAVSWGSISYDYGFSVAIDKNQNIYVTGSFSDVIDFDPEHGETFHTSNGGGDIFVVKYDPFGNYIWSVSWGGVGNDRGWSIAVDESGNSYITGYFNEVVDFDPGEGIFELYGSNQDPFLSKLDINGNLIWAVNWGNDEYEISYDVDYDNSGHVYVSGLYIGLLDFDPGDGVVFSTAHGEYDAFLSKFDSSGNFKWVRTWGGLGYDVARGVTVDNSGNVLTTGNFHLEIDLDPGPGEAIYVSNGCCDTTLSKFTPNGDFIYARVWGGVSAECGYALTTDDSESIYVTGYFTSDTDFDPGPDEDIPPGACSETVFVSKFNSIGDYQWANTFGGGGG